MEAGTANVASARPAPSERPSWLRMTVLAGLTVVIGHFVIAGVEIVLALTRFDADPDLLRLPTSLDDRWAWSSYAVKTLLACWLFAWAGRRCVRDWTDDWDMRIWPVAVAIAFALASLDARRSLTLAGCALVVVVARNVALVPRPAPRWGPSRWTRAAVIAALVAVAVVALAYRPLHPLSAAFADRHSNSSFSMGTGSDPTGTYRTFGFMLGNEGPATVTVRSVHAYDEAPPHVDVLTQRTGMRAAHSLATFERPVGMEHIAHGDRLHAWLRLSHASCHGPLRVRSDEVSELVVRYETLGFAGTQRLPIDPPARLRCPGRH